MKKVFDQTVRDLKREVNKKVLKVPGIEQKILDATSNEPWGPHGTLLADIAQATRNYHEYQMIMAVIWKRINDTGKNWRHVYKALTVLEYLVGHGSERVIDEIREHAYQISTLSDFQYIDSSGRDQGSNVRKKSQSLVVLVNDKERIIEVRQKAAVNREKFRSASSGGMYRPGSHSSTGGYGDRYDDDRYEGRYGSRDEDRNGYGYGRDYRDDDRYSKDSYGRDGDRYGRDDDRSSRDDEFRDRGFDDDGQSSARGSGARADDPQDRRLERKFSEQNIAPPSYEEAVSAPRSPAHSERNGETPAASVPGVSSPPAPRASSPPIPKAASPSTSNNPSQTTTGFTSSVSPPEQGSVVADEFDPRGPTSAGFVATAAPAVATTSTNAEMDLLGSLSDSFAANPLAIMPVAPATTATSESDAQASFSGTPFGATQPVASVVNQSFDDPFGDSPFKAIPTTDDAVSAQQPVATLQPAANQYAEMSQTVPQDTMNNNFNFGDSFSAITYSAPDVQPASTNSQFQPLEHSTSNQELDILADILPPPGPSPGVAAQNGFSGVSIQPTEPSTSFYGDYNSRGPVAPAGPNMGPQAAQFSSGNFLQPGVSSALVPSNMGPQAPVGTGAQFNSGNFLPQQGSVAGPTQQFNKGNFFQQQGSAVSGGAPPAPHTTTGLIPHYNNANFLPQQGNTTPDVPQAAHNNAPIPIPQFNNGNFLPQQSSAAPAVPQAAQPPTTGPTQFNNGGFMPQQGYAAPVVSQVGYQTPTPSVAQHNDDIFGGLLSQGPSVASQPALTSSTGQLALVSQPPKDKFETKSTVWADTLSRGLVNLNISGSKINPLSDIGIDFDAINRKEKRLEKPTQAPVTSTVTMGKAMGSGSGMGRAGASAPRGPPNPMMSSGMGMGSGMNMGMWGMGGGPGPGMGMGGMGGGPGPGMGMGGYGGGMNPSMSMGMGMGMNPGMGMNMGMAQGGHMQPPGSAMSGGYNPMMGRGGYPQQPYGGGYR